MEEMISEKEKKGYENVFLKREKERFEEINL